MAIKNNQGGFGEKSNQPQISKDEKVRAEVWDNPKSLLKVEAGRYKVQEVLTQIISGVLNREVVQGAEILEVGAGTGYLKDLVPDNLKQSYISSDYSLKNLKAGQELRSLEILQAPATAIPLPENSKDVVISMDAYDTFPSILNALKEAARVLRPGGKFILFQVNIPSDDIVEYGNSDITWFPTKQGASVVGVDKSKLRQNLNKLSVPDRKIITDFLSGGFKHYCKVIVAPDSIQQINKINELINKMEVEITNVPSLIEYFRERLENCAEKSGLEILKSEFVSNSIITDRNTNHDPRFNVFPFVKGMCLPTLDYSLRSESPEVRQEATIYTFVAQKK